MNMGATVTVPNNKNDGQKKEPFVPVKHVLKVVKSSERRLNLAKLQKQVNTLIERGMAGGRKSKGWDITIQNNNEWFRPKLDGIDYVYDLLLEIVCSKEKEKKIIDIEFGNIVKIIAKAGAQPKWEIALIDDKAPNELEAESLNKQVEYAPIEIPRDWPNFFRHIYNRESQISIIKNCIEAGIDSAWRDRFHVALIGDPSAGKTEILRSLKTCLGEDAVMEYDATATTQAGAIKDLDEREFLPRILIVEEIEKAQEDSLRWLLAVMDQRAEIRAVKFRSNIQKEARMLTFCTVNDYPLFGKLMYGALASRFSYHLYCPSLDRATLERILNREILRVPNGKRAWMRATLDYAEEQNPPITDPRKLIAICLSGKDELLTGEFQKKLDKCKSSDFLKLHEKK